MVLEKNILTLMTEWKKNTLALMAIFSNYFLLFFALAPALIQNDNCFFVIVFQGVAEPSARVGWDGWRPTCYN